MGAQACCCQDNHKNQSVTIVDTLPTSSNKLEYVAQPAAVVAGAPAIVDQDAQEPWLPTPGEEQLEEEEKQEEEKEEKDVSEQVKEEEAKTVKTEGEEKVEEKEEKAGGAGGALVVDGNQKKLQLPVVAADDEFIVSIERVKEASKLGIVVYNQEGEDFIRIRSVKQGLLVHRWNVANPDKEMKAGHIIMQVNEMTEADEMRLIIGDVTRTSITMRVKPAPKVDVPTPSTGRASREAKLGKK